MVEKKQRRTPLKIQSSSATLALCLPSARLVGSVPQSLLPRMQAYQSPPATGHFRCAGFKQGAVSWRSDAVRRGTGTGNESNPLQLERRRQVTAAGQGLGQNETRNKAVKNCLTCRRALRLKLLLLYCCCCCCCCCPWSSPKKSKKSKAGAGGARRDSRRKRRKTEASRQ
ncbi:hypothetical protein DFJ77DRAFT_343588 [Powellomyces hirtus]|nr:hypothetical protein DFJ77DRAFT_343588 [Powellomyces hirtus]